MVRVCWEKKDFGSERGIYERGRCRSKRSVMYTMEGLWISISHQPCQHPTTDDSVSSELIRDEGCQTDGTSQLIRPAGQLTVTPP